MMIETWQAGAGIAASMAMVGAAVVAVVRHMLRSEFVPRAQHDGLERRVMGMERHLANIPNEHDVNDLMRRLGNVETGVAVVQTTINGVNAGLNRVEHTVALVLEHQLGNAR